MSRLDEYIEADTLADATYVSDVLSGNYPNTSFVFQCLDSAGNVVPATAGSVVVEGSEDNVNWGSIANGTIDLSSSSYVRPIISGAVIRYSRVTLTGVTATGAVGFRLLMNRYL